MTPISDYKSPVTIPREYLSELHVDGFTGRLMTLPKKSGRTIVYISGHHTAHERTFAIAQLLQDYGTVIAPDIPGFGGMNSLYSQDKPVTHDALADFLYTFMRQQQLNKDITFFATSFGSQVVTRMLQKYPETQTWTKDVIGFVALNSKNDFAMNPLYKLGLQSVIYPGSTKFGAWLLKKIVLGKIGMKLMIDIFSRVKSKMQSEDLHERDKMAEMEKYLWDIGDLRTHATTTVMMFTQNLVDGYPEKIDLTLHNIAARHDQYLNNDNVELSARQIYKDYVSYELDSAVHMPSMISSKQQVKQMFPAEMHQLLSRK